MKRGDWKYIIGGLLLVPVVWAFFYIVFGAGDW